MASRCALAIGIPASGAAVQLAVPLTQVLFERGNFDRQDSALTARMVVGYGVSVWAVIAILDREPGVLCGRGPADSGPDGFDRRRAQSGAESFARVPGRRGWPRVGQLGLRDRAARPVHVAAADPVRGVRRRGDRADGRKDLWRRRRGWPSSVTCWVRRSPDRAG